MKFFIFFGSAIILAHFTEQQIVLLKPGSGPQNENSHELLQLDPAVRDADDEISAQKGEDASEDTSSAQSQSDEEEDNDQEGDNQEEDSDQEDDSDQEEDSDQGEDNDEEDSEQSEPSESISEAKHPGDEGLLLILQYANKGKGSAKFGNEEKIRYWNKWVSEIAAGNKGDIAGTNPHIYQPNEYPDFNRRFVPVYPYKEEPQNVIEAPDNKEIIPIAAPLEVVRLVAKESAMKEAAKVAQDNSTEDLMRNKILRTGDYWNALWIEKVEPKAALRTENNQILSTIKAKVKPGSEFYDVVANMTKISPKLLYIINDKKAS